MHIYRLLLYNATSERRLLSTYAYVPYATYALDLWMSAYIQINKIQHESDVSQS